MKFLYYLKFIIKQILIIDRPLRRSLTENDENNENDEILPFDNDIIETQQPQELIRTFSRRSNIERPRTPITTTRKSQIPKITDRTIIKQEEPIKRLTNIEEQKQEIQNDKLKGDLLDAVLQAQLLTI